MSSLSATISCPPVDAGPPSRLLGASRSPRRLAICLPTYNRCDLLAESLAALIERVRPHRIPIHVSDNCSDDATGAVVARLQTGYDLLHYSRSDVVLPVDDHFMRVLGLADADYRWLFGDHYRIVGDEALRQVLAALDGEPDFVVLNAENRVRGIATRTYIESHEVLEQLGWHMTMMTSLVYRAGTLKKMNMRRFRQTQFIQMLSILEYLEDTDFSLRWIGDVVVGSVAHLPKNNWQPYALDIFVRKWFVGVMSLPTGYSFEAKAALLRAHTDNTGLFSFKNLLHLKSLGAISLQRVRQYGRELPYVFDRGRILRLYVALCVPARLIRLMKRIRALARSGRSTSVHQ